VLHCRLTGQPPNNDRAETLRSPVPIVQGRRRGVVAIARVLRFLCMHNSWPVNYFETCDPTGLRGSGDRDGESGETGKYRGSIGEVA
jgi:hypothetical protein